MSDPVNERCRVAQRLRSFVTDDSVYATVDASDILHALGLHYADIDRIYFCGYDVARLADLIEPSEPKVRCVAEVKVDGERLEELVHDAAVKLTGIDRDALLALADEIDAAGDRLLEEPELMVGATGLMRCYAYGIREALGVES